MIPAARSGTNYQAGDNWKNIKYNFGPRPKPFPASPELARRAYNGVSIGKGHLAEAKAVIASPAASARGAFSNNGHARGTRGARSVARTWARSDGSDEWREGSKLV